jgi:hypothetical protein
MFKSGRNSSKSQKEADMSDIKIKVDNTKAPIYWTDLLIRGFKEQKQLIFMTERGPLKIDYVALLNHVDGSENYFYIEASETNEIQLADDQESIIPEAPFGRFRMHFNCATQQGFLKPGWNLLPH